MNTKNFQASSDLLIKKLILWALPKWLKPNFLSWLRIAMIPLLLWFLETDQYGFAFLVFVLAASTDFVDGALARTRDQITEFGKVLDPIADKLLVGSALAILGHQYLIVQIFLIFIALEILATLLSSFLAYKIGRPTGANVFGKVKMILQSISIGLLFTGLILNNGNIIEGAAVILGIALIFAVVSAVLQLNTKIDNIFKFLNLEKSLQTLRNLLKKV